LAAAVVADSAGSVVAAASAEVAVVPTGKPGSTMHLDDLVAQLRLAHGDALVGVVLYGSAASDELVVGHSDQNVLVIVESLSAETLRTLGQTARAWQEAGNPPPLELTRREWLRSADVFPMEYADILERHRVLTGTLPMDGVVVRLSDLRLQVEQEALGKLLRLRRATMTAGTEVARQREVLRASLSAMLVIFRSVLRLHGEKPARDAAEVIAHVGSRCGFDASPFLKVQRLVRGGVISDGEVSGVLTAYLAGAEALVTYLDQFALPADAP
jgi:predicted nucleotidyltransferase